MSDANNVKLVVLETGEQVLGRVADTSVMASNDGISLENPLYVVPEATKINTLPYLMLAKTNIAFFQDKSIRHVFDPVDELVDVYNKSFSKIAVPEHKKIIV